MTTRGRRAVGYIRRSTNFQEHSLGDQRDAIVKYAQEHGFEIQRFYEDDAISGTGSRDRDDFLEMIDAAQQKPRPFDCVLVYDVKRFSRMDNDETGYYRHILRMHGVTVWYTSEGFTDTFLDDLVRPVKQWQARQESRDLAKIIIRGKVSKFAAKGGDWRLSAHAPYGYDRRYEDASGGFLCTVRNMADIRKQVLDEQGRLIRTLAPGVRLIVANSDRCRLVVSDPQRIATVCRIFYEYIELGLGTKTIATQLNDEGVPTAQGPRKPENANRPWCDSSVRMILTNPTYAGDVIWNRKTAGVFFSIRNGEPVERPMHESRRARFNKEEHWLVARDAHEPLVTRAVFDQAQRLLARKGRQRRHLSPDFCRDKGELRSTYVFTGLLWCASCGREIAGARVLRPYSMRRQRAYRARTYRRLNDNTGSCGCCRGKLVRARVLERVVYRQLASWYPERLRRDGTQRILDLAREQCRYMCQRMKPSSETDIELAAQHMSKGAIAFMHDLPNHLRSPRGMTRRIAIRRTVTRIALDLKNFRVATFVRPLPIMGAVAGGSVQVVARLPEVHGALLLGPRKRNPLPRPVRDLAWHLRSKPDSIRKLILRARDLIKGIGPRITESFHQEYIAFSVGLNFVFIRVRRERLRLYLSLDQSKMKSHPPNYRDVARSWTQAHGNAEFVITSSDELLKCRPFLVQAYKDTRQRGRRYFKTDISAAAAMVSRDWAGRRRDCFHGIVETFSNGHMAITKEE